MARWGSRVGEGADEANAPLLDYASIAFGYSYRSTAVVAVAEGARPAYLPSELSGQPGTRAPHVWLDRDGERLSTIDLFGRHYVLLTGSDGGAWVEAARSVTDTGVNAHRIGGDGDLADADGVWAEAYGVSDRGAVLIRPDGYVAWRSADAVDDPVQQLTLVLRASLSREQTIFTG